jgi:sec-independent protein translocase protein TatA
MAMLVGSPVKQEVEMVGFIGNIGTWELILILLVAVIVIGPSKLPDAARSLGKAVGEFRRATAGVKKEFEEAILLDAPAKTKSKSESVKEEIEVEELAPENNSGNE